MKQEDKELLLKDLCARLPYGVKCKYHHIQYIENGEIIDINRFGRVNIDGHIKDVCDIKPYLFPLSSMTEEQYEYFTQDLHAYITFNGVVGTQIALDWLNKNNFDYRGLIEKGLAIDCTNLNIY